MHWLPGSCGDIVQYLLSLNANVYTGFDFEINDDGRVIRKISVEAKQFFPTNQPNLVDSSDYDHGWLQREWSRQDCELLQDLSQYKIVVIGTHRTDQLEVVKNFLKSSVDTVGISYTPLMQKFVLKNYCSKVLNHDVVAKNYYKASNPELFEKFEQNNVFGQWALKNELLFKMNVPNEFKLSVDHSVDLSKLLAGNLQWVADFVPTQSRVVFEQWLAKQNPLFTHNIPKNSHYDKCIGRNTQASNNIDGPVELDLYDKIFINHYTKTHNLPPCKAATHSELLEFFEKL